MSSAPEKIIRILGLDPLPVEGGWWTQSWRGDTCSAIYYLLAAPEFSAVHRLTGLEIYTYHTGAPARMLLLDNGSVREHVLGPDVGAGQRPQVVVPAGVWQATETTGEWTLMGTVVVPPYTDDSVEFGVAELLSAEYPDHAAQITRLCRR